jgi:hypothetical protein
LFIKENFPEVLRLLEALGESSNWPGGSFEAAQASLSSG